MTVNVKESQPDLCERLSGTNRINGETLSPFLLSPVCFLRNAGRKRIRYIYMYELAILVSTLSILCRSDSRSGKGRLKQSEFEFGHSDLDHGSVGFHMGIGDGHADTISSSKNPAR